MSNNNDVIISGRGNDVISGGSGNDLIISGGGSDTIDGGDGNDLIFAGKGDDTINGGDGNDLIFAGKGADTVDGGDGNDHIIAGSGDDTVDAGAGNDIALLGQGNDTYNYNADENMDSWDFASGGWGYDTLVISISQSLLNAINASVEILEDAFNDYSCWHNFTSFSEFGLNLVTYSFEEIIINVINDNESPIANNDNIEVNAPQTVGNLYADNGNGIDFDPDGDAIIVTQVNGADYDIGSEIILSSGNALIIQSNGDFHYEVNAQAVPVFTGDANADFANLNGVVTVVDGSDLGLPPILPYAYSGWDINEVHILYDSLADTLHVGIDTFGIFGDADGDGDPSNTSNALSNLGGTDLADLDGSETFNFLIDSSADNTFNPELVVGVNTSSDINSFNMYEVDGYNSNFNVQYGDNVTSSSVSLHANPSASAPDLEFSISNFFATLGTSAVDGFDLNIGAGSSLDSGIGEESGLANALQSIHIDLSQTISDSFEYTIEDENGGLDTATVELNGYI